MSQATISENQLNSLVSTTVTITWKAFAATAAEKGRIVSSVSFVLPHDYSNEEHTLWLLNSLYSDTNRYQGVLWNTIEPLLDPRRTHTALSVGDEIQLYYSESKTVYTWRVEEMGWLLVSRI